MKYVFEELNRNVKDRDEILFGDYDPDKYSGGVRHFSNLNVDKLTELIDNDFIEIDERQNLSPSTAEFYEFMQNHPAYMAHGYATSNTRSDYRITIEGLHRESKEEVSTGEYNDFRELCQLYEADEVVGAEYCWWD